MPDPIRQLESLRALRRRDGRDLSIGTAVAATRDHVDRTRRRVGDLIELWQELVPPALAAQTSVTGLRRGVVHVVADSAAVVYELDRLLREGLIDRIRARSRVTIVRVKIKVGPSGDDDRRRG